MNESTVSSPFMKQLRAALPGSLVIKHHDASMIGLPDCEVLWQKKVVWFEFKLIVPPKRKAVDKVYVAELAAESPRQHLFMCQLAEQTHGAVYICWVKRSSRIIVWEPRGGTIVGEFETTPELVNWAERWLRVL